MKVFITYMPNGNIQWQDYNTDWIGSPYCEQTFKKEFNFTVRKLDQDYMDKIMNGGVK